MPACDDHDDRDDQMHGSETDKSKHQQYGLMYLDGAYRSAGATIDMLPIDENDRTTQMEAGATEDEAETKRSK